MNQSNTADTSANAGNTSQDLKTGFLVGATPRNQQISLMIGVLVSVFVIGFTLMGMNRGLEEFRAYSGKQLDLAALPSGVDGPSTGRTRTLAVQCLARCDSS